MHRYKAGFRGRGRRRSSLETPGLHQSPPLEMQGAFAEQQQRQHQFGYEPTGPPAGWMHNAVPYSGQHETSLTSNRSSMRSIPSLRRCHGKCVFFSSTCSRLMRNTSMTSCHRKSFSTRNSHSRHSPPGGDDLLSSNYAGPALRPREADWYKAAGILPLATLPPERGGCAAVLLGVEMRKGAQCIGHMGGKREDRDGRPAETAWRETWEESGKVLTREARQAFMAATDSGAARVLWVRDCKQVLYAYRVPVEWGDALAVAFNGAAASGGGGSGGGGAAAGSGVGPTRAGATADRSNTTLLELRWVPVRELEAAASSGRVAGFMPAPLLRAMLRDRAFIAELQAAPAEAADAAQLAAAGARLHWGALAEAVGPGSRGTAELAAQAAQEPAAAGGFADWQHGGGGEAAAQQQETAPAGEHQAAAPAAENPEDVSMAEDEGTSTTDDEEDVSMAEEQEEAESAAQHQEAAPAAQLHGDVPVAERAGAAQSRAQPGVGEEPATQQQAARQVETLVWSDEDEDNFDTGFDDLIAVLRAAP
ncbi:hypothetical protein JKP88DRAFT_309949 [Tribonema minus]|uniref:Nudix hydrolase domain-containing protein n=1 Tax=Tribonema minus TaxID=303371 RepID=A0A836CHE9_9STRA|nr:hypothetical protein JKP88DRAFT_309949 [Tribonema minus]